MPNYALTYQQGLSHGGLSNKQTVLLGIRIVPRSRPFSRRDTVFLLVDHELVLS